MNESGQRDVHRELERFRKKYQEFNQQISGLSGAEEFSTPHRVIYEQGAFRLREFVDDKASGGGEPVLIVYSHVNRPGIIDIDAAHSMVRRLMDTGNRVFLMDWQRTRDEDRFNSLALYVIEAIGLALDRLNELTGQSRINLLGVCQGGTFALCHACIQPWRIKRLGLLVTPVDFHSGDSLIRHWSRWVDFEKLARYPVNIPGRLITLMFQLARPFDDLSRQVRLINQPVSEHGLDFMRRMDHWVYDCPDQPGRAFAQFMQWMYQDNALVSGTLTLGNVDVDLARVDFPVMNVYAENDHLVPPESSAALRGLINTDCYNEMRFCGGHVGLMVSARAQRDLLPELGRWLSASRDQG